MSSFTTVQVKHYANMSAAKHVLCIKISNQVKFQDCAYEAASISTAHDNNGQFENIFLSVATDLCTA